MGGGGACSRIVSIHFVSIVLSMLNLNALNLLTGLSGSVIANGYHSGFFSKFGLLGHVDTLETFIVENVLHINNTSTLRALGRTAFFTFRDCLSWVGNPCEAIRAGIMAAGGKNGGVLDSVVTDRTFEAAISFFDTLDDGRIQILADVVHSLL